MDGRRFDEWTRLLTLCSSRRATTGALAGGALASALGLLGASRAAAHKVGIAATCKNKGDDCDDDDECCSDNCRNGNCKCAGDGDFCDQDRDCCSNDCDNGNCRDDDGGGGDCRNKGDDCDDDNDCCSNDCRNGNCACAGDGRRCDRDKDCCSNDCDNGFCDDDDGGGGFQCGVTACREGWSCCPSSGVGRCYDPDFLHCCGVGICPNGWDCCGFAGGCCTPGWHCCGNGRCCPDGWSCGQIACFANQSGDRAASSAETVPFADPVAGDERKWIKKGWLEADSSRDRRSPAG